MLEFKVSPGSFVKSRRKQLGLTQKALAELVNLSSEMIVKIEKNDRPIVPANIDKFAKALQIPQEQTEEFCSFVNHYELNKSYPNSIQEDIAKDGYEGQNVKTDVVVDIRPSLPKNNKNIYLWVIRISVFVLGCLGAVFWSSRLSSGFFETPEFLRPNLPLCSNDSANSLFRWHQGRSKGSRCLAVGNGFVITAGGGTIQNGAKQEEVTAPLLTRQVQGDFLAQVLVTYNGGSWCCRHAGFGIRLCDNDATWLRIDKESRDHQITAVGLIDGLTTKPDIDDDDAPYSFGSEPIWFQIERRGSTVIMRYSYDGNQWIDYFKNVELPASDKWELFFMVEAAHNSLSSNATFSNFSVKTLSSR